jgi:hypothetical protein
MDDTFRLDLFQNLENVLPVTKVCAVLSHALRHTLRPGGEVVYADTGFEPLSQHVLADKARSARDEDWPPLPST